MCHHITHRRCYRLKSSSAIQSYKQFIITLIDLLGWPPFFTFSVLALAIMNQFHHQLCELCSYACTFSDMPSIPSILPRAGSSVRSRHAVLPVLPFISPLFIHSFIVLSDSILLSFSLATASCCSFSLLCTHPSIRPPF